MASNSQHRQQEIDGKESAALAKVLRRLTKQEATGGWGHPQCLERPELNRIRVSFAIPA
jgi:hypothetical protein